jgi:hypothetical protein
MYDYDMVVIGSGPSSAAKQSRVMDCFATLAMTI